MSAPTKSSRTSWLIGLGFAALYVWTASRTVQGGDAGEFATVVGAGGVPHPPGYPIFVLLGRLVHACIPVGSVAFHAALPAAIAGAAAVGLLHRSLMRMGAGGFGALVGALSLGFSTHFWRYATVAEVFTLAAFCAALLIWVATEIRLGWSGWRPVLLLGLVFAIGLGSHHHVALLAPLGAWALWKVPSPRPLWKWVLFLGGVLCGLLPYGIYLEAQGAWVWGGSMDLSAVTDHLLRRDYGTFTLGHADSTSGLWAHPKDYLQGLPLEFLGPLLVLGVWGMRSLMEGEHSGLGNALVVTWLVAGVGFFAAFNLPAEGFWEVVASRFWLVPNVIFAAWVGIGAGAMLSMTLWSSRFLPIFLALCTLSVQMGISATKSPHHRSTWLEDYLHNTLDTVAENAVIFGTGDSRLFGMRYVQSVQGKRPDVLYVTSGLLGQEWYREDMKSRAPGVILEGDLAERVNANLPHRPVYLAIRLYDEKLAEKIPAAWPEGGVLMRVQGPNDSLPSPEQIALDTEEKMEAFKMTSRPQNQWQATQTWEYEAWDQYALAWERISYAFAVSGRVGASAKAMAIARDYSPWLFD